MQKFTIKINPGFELTPAGEIVPKQVDFRGFVAAVRDTREGVPIGITPVNADGTAELPCVPAGLWEVIAWHPDTGTWVTAPYSCELPTFCYLPEGISCFRCS